MRVRLALRLDGTGVEKHRRLAAEAVLTRYERADLVRCWMEGEDRWFEFEAGRRLRRVTRAGIELPGPFEVVVEP